MKDSRPQLFLASSASEAWSHAIQPWLKKIAPRAWQDSRPSLIVTPTRGQANFLREHWLRTGGSHLGLHFVNSVGLRKLIGLEALDASGENFRLLLAIAAAEIEQQSNESDFLAAKTVVRSPAHLLRTLERIRRAGWDFEQLQLPAFRRIVHRFRQLLELCGFTFPGDAERFAFEKAASGPTRFAHLLITGFDGAHWPHWFLLRAALALAENAAVILKQPRPELDEIDLCWIGSWEEECGAPAALTKPPATRGESFFTEAEMRGRKTAQRIDFLIGLNAAEQAEAITQQSLRYLAEGKCTRLGVIFAGHGALPRLVANALSHHQIPHNDAIAHIVPGIFESPEWQTWIALQRAPRLRAFLRFLNALPDPKKISPDLSRPILQKILRESYEEILIDDLDLLRAACAARADEKFQLAARVLNDFVFLPSQASLAQFLEETQRALLQLGWKQHAFEIAAAGRVWPNKLTGEFSRALFLRWLEESAATFGPARDEMGNHPYARVHLLGLENALEQDWSHLIFAGWNEGAWPPPAGAEFARDEEIRAFNRGVQQLNKRAARQGSQGEGHTTVRENHALYLGPIEQRAIALRQFDALIESASEAVTLTASLVHEDAPERFWNPSECLAQFYFKTRQRPLTQSALKNLQRSTALWLEKPAAPLKSGQEIAQTLIAFNARRDGSVQAGEYDFALREQNDYRPVPSLSVSDLEGMVSSPAIVWMKRYLGVEAEEDAGDLWKPTTGKWVHRWLAGIGAKSGSGIYAPFPNAKEIDARIEVLAKENLRALEKLCHSLGKRVPDWWRSGWLNARYSARQLGERISHAKDWNWMTAELRIGDEGVVKIDEDVTLQLRGRIDLVVTQTEAASFQNGTFWIVDYKTGKTKEVGAGGLHDSLVRGTALQLGLYALVLRALGAADVGVSIISSAVRKIKPQLHAKDLIEHTNVFADLAEMQRTGIFGMKGALRPAFGFARTYPLAMLGIDDDVLQDKWQRTHKNLVLEKEEWET